MIAMNRIDWAETTATVYSCGWEDTQGRGFLFHSLSGLFSGKFLIVFSYAVNGNHLSGEFTSSRKWKEGTTFPLKYNPQNPEENDRANEGGGWLANAATWAGGIAIVVLYLWLKNRK
jgi:hypothetical protein